MTRDTSSTGSSSRPKPERFMAWMPGPRGGPCPPITVPRAPAGGPYTLGNNGAVADDGLEVPFVPVPPNDVSGESGRDKPERGASLIRDSEKVKSRDCARFVNERGFVSWSFIFESSSESEPRLIASSAVSVR